MIDILLSFFCNQISYLQFDKWGCHTTLLPFATLLGSSWDPTAPKQKIFRYMMQLTALFAHGWNLQSSGEGNNVQAEGLNSHGHVSSPDLTTLLFSS